MRLSLAHAPYDYDAGPIVEFHDRMLSAGMGQYEVESTILARLREMYERNIKDGALLKYGPSHPQTV